MTKISKTTIDLDLPILGEVLQKLDKIEQSQEDLKQAVHSEGNKRFLNDFVDYLDFCKAFKIERSTFMRLKRQGKVSVIQHGKVILLTKAAILEYAECHAIKATI